MVNEKINLSYPVISAPLKEEKLKQPWKEINRKPQEVSLFQGRTDAQSHVQNTTTRQTLVLTNILC